MENGGYVGYTGASSTAVSVVADIAESLDISGTVNVSGTSLNNILTKNTEIDAVLDTIKVDTEAIETATEAIQVDAAAIEVLLTAANVDHAAIEVLLTGIDADTNAIKVDAAANEVLLTAIDTVLDTIKVDTEAIETAVEGTLAVSGGLTLDSILLDEDVVGDNPQTDTVIKAAPGSGSRIVLYGYAITAVADGAGSFGLFALTDGAVGSASTGATNVKIAGRAQGITPMTVSQDFTHGVPLTANTALKLTTLEGSGNMYLYGVIHYTIESV